MNWRHLFIGLRILDAWTTMALYYGPGAVEMNPLMNRLLSANMWWFMFIQILGALGIICLLNRMLWLHRRPGQILTIIVVGLSAIVVASNLIAMFGFYYYVWNIGA